ncbi:hypothetical protein [Acetobacter vaccinii]|uniref:Uncharacterized protein n=1 Tax=Acetobacter vaccinii TaxID=2592655 RepID=A0A5C1YRX1_9PROT|nr:hypothetical protein [Acetobacter vaccinii]QEO18338.1 hypothetical protein FLP30_11950 [Acetobacter vaccinii]
MANTSATLNVCQVIPFQMEILSRHKDYLMRWLEAGMPMGVSDADIFPAEEKQSGMSSGYVLVWVRETPDPAYKVYSRGNRWFVVDAIRDNVLGNFPSFSGALNMIRPVLTVEKDIVAA